MTKINYFILFILVTFIFSEPLKNENGEEYKEIITTEAINPIDTLETFYIDDFDRLALNVKVLFSETVLADMAGDTISTEFYTSQLVEALFDLKEISNSDYLPSPDDYNYNRKDYYDILKSVIKYLDKSKTISNSNYDYELAILEEEMFSELYYSKKLQDIRNSELDSFQQEVEIVIADGHVPIMLAGDKSSPNRRVKAAIERFQKKNIKKHIQKWLNRSSKYKKIILPILKQEGVPPELFYVAMVESGLKPTAESFASAVGPWQFIDRTGIAYGLNLNKELRLFYDERRDFEKSTRSAARYLRDLYDKYNDWYLAFAAYNTGESRIDRHMATFNVDNFWDLDRISLETQQYIPKIMAIIHISNDPEYYGFTINPEPDFEWFDVKIDKNVHLTDIADISGLDIKILEEYNPEIIYYGQKKEKMKAIVLDSLDTPYNFRMPVNCNDDFIEKLAMLEDVKDDIKTIEQIITYKVQRGDSFWKLAVRYNTTITKICRLNNLNRNKPLRIGKIIKIPSNSTTPSEHVVKRGDTLSEIAQKYDTTIKDLKKLNPVLNKRKYIYIGQVLKLR